MKIIPLTGLVPNSSYSVSVRGKDSAGNYTEWSSFQTFTSQIDSVPPSTPVAPTVSLAGPQNIIVEHTLNTTSSGKLETDVVYLEVQTSDSTDSYVATTTIGNIPVGPLSSAGVSQRFVYPAPSYNNNVYVKARVRAVDRSGNQSSWSAWSSPSSTIPYFDAAYIGSLTVDSLSAEKITSGTLGLVNTAADTKLSIGDNSTYIMLRNNHLTGSTSPKGQMYIATTGTPSNPTGAVGSGYRDTNTKFYVDSTGKFSLGTGLYWDGSTLVINGNGSFTGTVNASGGTFSSYITAGSTNIGTGWTVNSLTYDGIKISSNNYWGVSGSGDANARFKVGDANNYVQWSGSQLDVKGNIVATGGSFTSYMTAGNVYLGNGITITGTGVSGTYNGLYVGPYNFFAESGGTTKFQVGNNTNYMRWTGSALEIAGNITSTATISGGSVNVGTDGAGTPYINLSSGTLTFKYGGSTQGILQGNSSSMWSIGSNYTASTTTFSGGTTLDSSTVVTMKASSAISMTAGAFSPGSGVGIQIDPTNGPMVFSMPSGPANTGYPAIRNIWMQTNAPSPLSGAGVGGQDGDIWLVYV